MEKNKKGRVRKLSYLSLCVGCDVIILLARRANGSFKMPVTV